MGYFSINRDLLPMKGHYFLFNAGTAPLVPYLPTYAKQLGFSSYIVGIIYTFLPIFGLLAKPIFCAIADRYQKHKVIFIAFQIVTIVAFSGLHFIKEVPVQGEVHLSCGNGESFLDVCSNNVSTINECSANRISNLKLTEKCDMSCTMNSPQMWQTVCEEWKGVNYCYNKSSEYSRITYYDIQLNEKYFEFRNNCLYYNVLSDTHCTKKFNTLMHANCSMICDGNVISRQLISNQQHLVCEEESPQLRVCTTSGEDLGTILDNDYKDYNNCKIHCRQSTSYSLSEYCENTKDNDIKCSSSSLSLPNRLHFTGIIPLDKTLKEGMCVYFKLYQVMLDDGSIHFPICSKTSPAMEHFHSQCDIKCENAELNELLSATKSRESEDWNSQLWIFFVLMALNWIGMAVVVSISDAICFEKLGDSPEKYGQQRMWGSAGWGIFSLLTGFLVDKFSQHGDYKNYFVAFVLMLIMLSLDVIVSLKLKYKRKTMSVNIFHKVGLLFKDRQVLHFFIWIILVGMCTGLLWQFLFWYLEDLANQGECSQSDWIKTLQGFVSVIQCFLGEIPFLFFSGRIINKIGHIHSMTLVLLAFGIRFVLYSLLTNPWWVLPIELLQGLTFGVCYAIMTSYASIIAPEGTEATLQGTVGAVFEGIGTSLGSLVGGAVYEKLGGMLTFRIFGCVALGACLLNIVLAHFFHKSDYRVNRENEQGNADYTSIIRFAAPNDAIDLLTEQ